MLSSLAQRAIIASAQLCLRSLDRKLDDLKRIYVDPCVGCSQALQGTQGRPSPLGRTRH